MILQSFKSWPLQIILPKWDDIVGKFSASHIFTYKERKSVFCIKVLERKYLTQITFSFLPRRRSNFKSFFSIRRNSFSLPLHIQQILPKKPSNDVMAKNLLLSFPWNKMSLIFWEGRRKILFCIFHVITQNLIHRLDKFLAGRGWNKYLVHIYFQHGLFTMDKNY